MFTSHALPPPSTFAQEHRPLRLTSDAQRPLPAGECRFILLHPSIQNQRCSCQSFHHNRSTPGSSCDCGHQACYHVHTQPGIPDAPPSRDAFQLATQTNLADRVRRLEEALNHERRVRETTIREERQARERDIRIFREALHPFYKSEEEMRRKLIEIEDRIEGNYDEQLRWKDRITAIDDASMGLERRIEELEGNRKRRRISRLPSDDVPLKGCSASTRASNPSSSDDRFIPRPHASIRGSPPQYQTEPDEPRSSGILNLVSGLPTKDSPPYLPSRRVSPPREEARSSGFLALDLAERFMTKSDSAEPNFATSPIPIPMAGNQAHGHGRHVSHQGAPLSIVSVLDTPYAINGNGALSKRQTSVEVMEVSPGDGSPKKRKRDQDLMALDVLANVSMASPLA